MRFFKKRKVEEINLEIKETRSKEIDEKLLYSEKKDIKVDIFSTLELPDKKDLITKNFSSIQKKNYELNNSYYICKVFSKVALKDKDFNGEMLRLDKNINRIHKEFEDLQKKVNEVKYNENSNEELLNEANEKQKDMQMFQKAIQINVDNVRRKYFNYLKISTMNVCLNKSNFELEALNNDLNKFLDDYKNLTIAAEYIYYNSGVEVVKLINAIVNIVIKIGNEDNIKTYDFKYFLKSDVVITLDVTEWIDLYNKVKFVLKLNDLELYKNKEVVKLYKQFEIRYLILMMYLEVNKKTSFKY